ncbi:MAG TPA: sugar transferase [candidate division Zixibacteria bacterium]|nr:sugar transferase [candidate division Zixibacteria bacterium]MDD4918472.1 sugar transferase [candidate division Zixibacteria bacterium]MDM7971799.1 sugar transferase [candidate division Zixibacteria bacterium]HOD65909.1 sugar transferase [candidate division Zixibacteria bacterium]HPC11613.1 sugar transferase [candidate division Zixibacteria bacterium]
MSSVDVSLDHAVATPYLGLVEQVKYFACEYLHGLLFVACSMLFVMAFPAALTKPAKVKAMVNRGVKRTLDIVGAIIGLTLSLPIFLIVPILIKLDSPGPIFYTQTRIGVNRRRRDRRYHQRSEIDTEQRQRNRRRQDLKGKPFQVVKFRTMVANAEQLSGPVWASKGDPRITRLGQFMRKTRLDEIPQLLNVLMGDMSLVGPRPERPTFVAELSSKIDNYCDRLQVKPGLTGLAQVECGYDTDLASVVKKVSYDLAYIENWSIWLEIKILLRTVVVVVTGRGAN